MTTGPNTLKNGMPELKEDCPEIELLAAYIEHTLTPEETPMVEAHLVVCRLCRRTVILTFRNRGLIDDFNLGQPRQFLTPHTAAGRKKTNSK